MCLVLSRSQLFRLVIKVQDIPSYDTYFILECNYECRGQTAVRINRLEPLVAHWNGKERLCKYMTYLDN